MRLLGIKNSEGVGNGRGVIIIGIHSDNNNDADEDYSENYHDDDDNGYGNTNNYNNNNNKNNVTDVVCYAPLYSCHRIGCRNCDFDDKIMKDNISVHTCMWTVVQCSCCELN